MSTYTLYTQYKYFVAKDFPLSSPLYHISPKISSQLATHLRSHSLTRFTILLLQIAENPEIVKQINGIIAFNLGDEKWVVEAKKGTEGKVYEGVHPKPGVTLTMKPSDFVSMMDGSGNAQSLFMSGKIKMKGNMGLVMKMQSLTKLAQGGLSAKILFAVFEDIVLNNPDVVKKINGIYQWVITDTKDGSGKNLEYVIDVKNAPGSVYEGKVQNGKPGVTMTVAEKDFVGLMTGERDAQSLFMGGKLKLKGNMGLAMKLGQLQNLAPTMSKL